MYKKYFHHIAILSLLTVTNIHAENSTARVVTVLQSTDTSELGLGQPLQNAFGQLLQSTGLFQAKLSNESLPGFTKTDIGKTFEAVQSEALAFAYMEKQRLSIFLFDASKPGLFLVSFRLLTNLPQGQLTSEFIELNLREAVNELLANYSAGKFQAMPASSEGESNGGDNKSRRQIAEDAKILYKELADSEERRFLIGARIGMARFSANSEAASTVNFGGYAGVRFSHRLSTEIGLDVFSYSLLHADLHYLLPVAEKYISLYAMAGAGRFMGVITQNRGFSTTTIATGSTVFGPGIGFTIPLLGISILGDLRFYTGNVTTILGSYGVVYYL